MKTRMPQINLTIQPFKFQNSDSQMCSPDTLFRNLGQLIKKHPSLQAILQQPENGQSSLLRNQKTIKPRMFTKVAIWMEKLCLETLDFSSETYEISVKILKKYLEKNDESPKVLQMLGCTALHIASKLNQKTIIAIDSYIQCCMNIFNKSQFEEKQAIVYQTIAYKIPSLTFHGVLDFIQFEVFQNRCLTDQQEKLLKSTLKQMVKDLQFLQAQPITVVANLWVEIQNNPQFEFKKDEFLNLIKTRKFQY